MEVSINLSIHPYSKTGKRLLSQTQKFHQSKLDLKFSIDLLEKISTWQYFSISLDWETFHPEQIDFLYIYYS